MRVAIVENTAITHHGQLGVALHQAAARIDLYKPFQDGRLPEPGAHDALVVFGGEQSALDDATHPYLARLGQIMVETADQGRAVLGVCLGCQIFARGLGAQNVLGAAREFGWCDVALTDAGAGDPLLAQLPPQFPIFQWHSDTFTLPPAAQHLAQSGAAAQQGFRYGRAGYGIQFHFEASRAVVADWSREFPDLIDSIHPGWGAGDHAAHAATRGVQADDIGLAIARAFVGLI